MGRAIEAAPARGLQGGKVVWPASRARCRNAYLIVTLVDECRRRRVTKGSNARLTSCGDIGLPELLSRKAPTFRLIALFGGNGTGVKEPVTEALVLRHATVAGAKPVLSIGCLIR